MNDLCRKIQAMIQDETGVKLIDFSLEGFDYLMIDKPDDADFG